MTALRHLRQSARTLQILQPCKYNVSTSFRLFLRNESSFVPKRVLLVAKLSRYYFEQLREPELNEAELQSKLMSRGSNYELMLASHVATKNVEREVIETLQKLNIEYRIITIENLKQSNFAWADLIVPIGGDGTFLLTSNLIPDNKKPIIGINSNPERSEGFLLLPPKYTKNIPEIFEKLKAGHYRSIMRARIRTTLKGESIWEPPFHTHEKARVAGGEKIYVQKVKNSEANLPKERRLPWLALNEVFIGETLAAKTSTLLIKKDDEQEYSQVKSSGLCVSTGTGSTSWYKAINSVTPEVVQDILALVDAKRQFSKHEIKKICSDFNNSLSYSAENLKLCYAIRDMIVGDAVPVSQSLQPRGICNKFTVKSQCFDASLVLDGGIAMPFNYGTCTILETLPEDSLRSLTLLD